jgi:hypothetical protein
MEPHMKTDLITQALEMALGRQERGHGEKLVGHPKIGPTGTRFLDAGAAMFANRGAENLNA